MLLDSVLWQPLHFTSPSLIASLTTSEWLANRSCFQPSITIFARKLFNSSYYTFLAAKILPFTEGRPTSTWPPYSCCTPSCCMPSTPSWGCPQTPQGHLPGFSTPFIRQVFQCYHLQSYSLTYWYYWRLLLLLLLSILLSLIRMSSINNTNRKNSFDKINE